MARTVYKTGVTVTSTTLADLGDGIATGHIRYEDGKEYLLCKAAGTIADGVGGKKDATTSTVVTVIASAAVNDVMLCVNNTSGSLSSGAFFWGLKKGRGYGAPDAGGWNDGDAIIASATAAKWDGVANAEATTKDTNVAGIAVNDDSALNSVIIWNM